MVTELARKYFTVNESGKLLTCPPELATDAYLSPICPVHITSTLIKFSKHSTIYAYSYVPHAAFSLHTFLHFHIFCMRAT
jgi:hypothetical protein